MAPSSHPAPRHSGTVRLTHWLTVLCAFALLWSGINILISHPRFYWGEYGNVNEKPLFTIPIPASRGSVPTGYNYVLPDQNGWSRSLHFQAAWLLFFTALTYLIHGFRRRHFQRNLTPRAAELSPASLAQHLKSNHAADHSYNPIQRLTYLCVIFLLFPGLVWTGLAMAPGFTAAFPFVVEALGGQQSARTIHFVLTVILIAFVVTHLAMIIRAGFYARVRAMFTGRSS